jgi:hypothetical protein
VQADVTSAQPEEQVRVPPSKPSPWQVWPPRAEPSHCSPQADWTWPSPQLPETHDVVTKPVQELSHWSVPQ